MPKNIQYKNLSVLERFNKYYKIVESGCWEWLGGKNRAGYGRFSINNRGYTASRVSYELFIGELSKGLLICHKCDNPKCVNPFHIFKGTSKDNVQDCLSKGRQRKPEKGCPSEAMYKRGCRCELCKELRASFWAKYKNENYEKMRAANREATKRYRDKNKLKRLSLLKDGGT